MPQAEHCVVQHFHGSEQHNCDVAMLIRQFVVCLDFYILCGASVVAAVIHALKMDKHDIKTPAAPAAAGLTIWTVWRQERHPAGHTGGVFHDGKTEKALPGLATTTMNKHHILWLSQTLPVISWHSLTQSHVIQNLPHGSHTRRPETLPCHHVTCVVLWCHVRLQHPALPALDGRVPIGRLS